MCSYGDRELKQLMLKPKGTARFFKIILEEPPGEGRLALPWRFARKYGNDLPNQVFLEVPTGAVWKVDLVKSNDRLWLQNGWREFQEYYSIGHGSFLVFEYTRKSYFHVIVFDKTASEINYPFCAYDDCIEPKFGGEYDEAWTERNGSDNENMKILDDCLLSSKKRKKLPLPCRRPPKVGRTSFTLKSQGNPKLHQPAKRDNKIVSTHKHGKNRISQSGKVLRNDEKTRASLGASGSSGIQEFTELNPFFEVVVKPSDVNGSSYAVTIPFKFAKSYLRHKKGNVILQISQKKTWKVDFRIYSCKKIARFSSGWLAFVGGNNLETGDVCVFKLINCAKLVLKVSIKRASEGKFTPEPKGKFLLSCPLAGKTMRTAKLDSPPDLSTNAEPINHQVSRIKSEDSKGDLHLCDPKLQSKDSCKEKGSSDHKHKLSSKHVRNKPLTVDEKANAFSRASSAYRTANPFFMLAIQPSYTRSQLNIPFEFAKRHFKGNSGEIVLQVLDGRAWKVDYSVRSTDRKAQFRCSWLAFVRDNNLVVGDVCIFELIKRDKIVLKVIISRSGDTDPSFGSMHGGRDNVADKNIKVDTEIEFGFTPEIDNIRTICGPDGNSAGKVSVHEEKAHMRQPERHSCSWVPEIVESANKLTPSYPSFRVFLWFSNLRSKVTVPAKFMKFINQGAEKVLNVQLQVEEKTWPVKLIHYQKWKIAKLTSGWNVFSTENGLQVGDLCVFDLVDNESLLLKVSILSRNG